MTLEELYRILNGNNPSEELIRKEIKLFKLIPELKDCKGCEQNNKWHIYDVYEHIMHVVDNTPSTAQTRLAALFHDIGKPLARTTDENGVDHFNKHYEFSKKIFDKFCAKNKVDKITRIKVSRLIWFHDVDISRLSDEQIDRIVRLFSQHEIELLFSLKRADLLAQNPDYHYLLSKYEEEKEMLLNKYIKRVK